MSSVSTCKITTAHTYIDWIPAWTAHLCYSANGIKVPQEATSISTPLIPSTWRTLLASHPNCQLVQLFISDVSHSFCIGFKQLSKPLKSAKRNLGCALDHPETVTQYLADEIAQHRIAGLFNKFTIPLVRISKLEVILK